MPRRTTRGSACASGGRGRGRHVEARRHRAVVRAPGHADVHVGAARLADEPARERRGGAGDGHPVDSVERLAPPDARRRRAGRPREPRPKHRVRVRLTVRVAEPSVGEGGRHRPAQRVFHLRPDGGHGGCPVQVRRGVEVPSEERRHAAGALPGQRAEVRADLAEPGLALVLQHLGGALAVAHELRPVRARRKVHVRDCHHPARADRDVAEAHPAALHRIDRVVRDQVQSLVRVGHPRCVRDAPEIALGLLDSHHIGTRRPDRLADPVELNLSAAVPDVEGHHGERVGRGRGRAQQQRERGAERRKASHRATASSSGRRMWSSRGRGLMRRSIS